MLAPDILTKIPSSFKAGVESGDLFFFPSTVQTHVEAGIEVRRQPCCYAPGRQWI